MEYQEIIEAIRGSRDLGLPDDIIRKNLLNSKFDETEIDKAFEFLPKADIEEETSENLPQVTPAQVTEPASPVDLKPIIAPTLFTSVGWANLMQIFLFLSLYMFSASVVMIISFNIGKWFPVMFYPYFTGLTDFINNWQSPLLRGGAAMIPVSLTVFTFTLLWISTHEQIAKLALGTAAARFILYLTCVVYGLIIMASLIFTLFNIFNQTISVNILIHVSVAIIISAVILRYSLQQIKEIIYAQ